MKKTLKLILSVILYLWQLPQNLLGALLVIVYEPELSFTWNGVRLNYSPWMKSGVSLGRYVILKGSAYSAGVKPGTDEAHERGHSLQSMILGPLYLLVIGLPSLIHAARWKDGPGKDYYAFYTEKWADRLGGVTRC